MKTEYSRERLNALAADFDEIKSRRALMQEFGDVNETWTGVNEDGETVDLMIYPDGLTVLTYQKNGWVRKDYYDADGYDAGEAFDGRWK